LSRIAKVFQTPTRKALLTYLVTGYPDTDATVAAGLALAEAGADIIELGIPFSDPLADGATIQQASHRALAGGVTTVKCLEVVKRLRARTDIPLVLMTYYNPVYHYGVTAFCRDAAAAGADGLIIPDLPPEEGGELEAATVASSLDLIYLLAPTSTDERIRFVGEHSRGFIYLVSVTGVTGARTELPADLEGLVSRVRHTATKPVCVGFGISTPEQAARVTRIADGVIVGSRIVQLLDEPDPVTAIGDFTAGLRRAIDVQPV
jgi:tryptophan synthase alpha chain